MDELQRQDVPYGNDWDSAEEVAAWAEEADRIRPWRAQIREHIARFDDSPASTTLYMPEHEQREALAAAGFTSVRIELRMDSLVLYAGERVV